jgi:hypothetical protein
MDCLAGPWLHRRQSDPTGRESRLRLGQSGGFDAPHELLELFSMKRPHGVITVWPAELERLSRCERPAGLSQDFQSRI